MHKHYKKLNKELQRTRMQAEDLKMKLMSSMEHIKAKIEKDFAMHKEKRIQEQYRYKYGNI